MDIAGRLNHPQLMARCGIKSRHSAPDTTAQTDCCYARQLKEALPFSAHRQVIDGAA